jgi:hypothetical protein
MVQMDDVRAEQRDGPLRAARFKRSNARLSASCAVFDTD